METATPATPEPTQGLELTPELIESTEKIFKAHFAWRVRQAGLDPSDCLSACWEGILRRAHVYDPEKARKGPISYIYRRLGNLTSNYIRDQSQPFRRHYLGHRGPDGRVEDLAGYVPDTSLVEQLDADAHLQAHLVWIKDQYGEDMADRCRALVDPAQPDVRDRKAEKVLKARLRYGGEPLTTKEREELEQRFAEVQEAIEVSEAVDERLETLLEELQERLDALETTPATVATPPTDIGIRELPDGRLEVRAARRCPTTHRIVSRQRTLPEGTPLDQAARIRSLLDRHLVEELEAVAQAGPMVGPD